MSAEEPTVDPAPAEPVTEPMDTEEPEDVPEVPEEPVEARRSGRARKAVDHFTHSLAEKAETKIPEGKGTALGEIDNFQKRLSAPNLKADDNLVKKLYSLCFGTQGRKTVTKKHLRLFNGWDSDAQADSARKKMAGWDAKNILKPLCSLLDVESNGTRADLQDRLVAFLQSPEDSGKEFVPLQKAGTRKRKAASSKKSTKKSAKKSKNDGEPKKLSAYIMFSMETRPKIKAKHPEYSFGELQQAVSKKWKKVSEEEKEEWKEKGANYDGGDSKSSKAKKKSAAKKPAKKKQKREESEPEEESSEEESEEDEELQANIAKAVKKIVNTGDLGTLTKGKVREAVAKEFGQDAVTKYKSHIKEVMQEAVSERQEAQEGGADTEEKEEKEEKEEQEEEQAEEQAEEQTEEQEEEKKEEQEAEADAGDANMEAEPAEPEAAAAAE